MKQWTINQQKAINTFDSNVIVSASAGSGKTSAMVERAITLITQRKADIEDIMLLTFTNNSAREMKERLRVGLIEYAKNNEESIPFIREQLDNMGLADICTIDSFCLKLVQEFFELVGLSPSVGIQSEEEKSEDEAKARKNTIKRCEQDDAICLMIDTLSLRKDDAFLTLVKELYEYSTAQPDREQWLESCEAMYKEDVDFEHSPLSLYLATYMRKASRVYSEELRTLKGIFTSGKDASECKEIEFLLNVLDSVQVYENCQTLKDVYNAYATPYVKMRQPSGKKYDADFLKTIANIRDEFNEKFKKKLDELFSCGDTYESMVSNRFEVGKQVLQIIKAVRIYQEEYDKVKSEQNKIDFADVERYAEIILKNPDIQKEVMERHKYVFVDEFQDTNYLQESIIRKVTRPERLFVVGDVKQSIYRFRLAEPTIFTNILSKWEEEGKSIFFNDNFRSDNEILYFVNCVFDILMTPDFGDIDYKNKGRFTIRENAHESQVKPVTILTTMPRKKEIAEDDFKDENGIYDITKHELYKNNVDDAEAGLIYDYIESVIGKKIFVKGEEKIVDYSDIVLMYSKRSAPKGTLELLSKAGIPLNIGDFTDELGRKEFDVFMDYVQAINNSFDDYPFIGALHSFIGGLSNVELSQIKLKVRHKNSFYERCLEYVNTFDDEISNKLSIFFKNLDKYRFLSSTIDMSSFLKQVFEESGYSTYLASQKDGENTVSAINGFLEKIKGKRFAIDLHTFVNYYLEAKKIKFKASNSDSNGVKVCTLHSSKGLEFPIVIFAGLNAKDIPNTLGVNSDRELGVGMKYYDTFTKTVNETLDKKIIQIKKDRDEAEDRLRLLYVTLTRAQSALCIILPPVEEKCIFPMSTKNIAQWIDYCMSNDKNIESKKVVKEPHKFDEAEEFEKVLPNETEASEDVKNVLNYVYPHEIATKTARKYSVSTLNNEDRALTLPSIDPEERSFAGTAHHLVMQYIDLFATTRQEVQNELDRLLNENILQKEQYEEINIDEILDCLNSEVGELARTGECYREQKFVLAKKGDDVLFNGYQENVLVQGIVDLIIVGEKIVVVDFKRSKAKKETLIERYKTQLKLYGDAVKATFGQYPDRLLLYVFGRNEIIEVE